MKQILETPKFMAKKSKKEWDVTIYKVCISPMFSYYTFTLDPIVKVFFSREEAEKFIEGYSVPWIKPFLVIETDTRQYRETD